MSTRLLPLLSLLACGPGDGARFTLDGTAVDLGAYLEPGLAWDDDEGEEMAGFSSEYDGDSWSDQLKIYLGEDLAEGEVAGAHLTWCEEPTCSVCTLEDLAALCADSSSATVTLGTLTDDHAEGTFEATLQGGGSITGGEFAIPRG